LQYRGSLVEDCCILRTALTDLLNAAGCFEQFVPVDGLHRALNIYNGLQLSVVLLGPCQQSSHISDVAVHLLRAAPDARIVAFLLQDGEVRVAELLRIGVLGVVGRRANAQTLVGALTRVAEGGVYCEHRLDALIRAIDKGPASGHHKLAPREQRVLGLIAGGKTSKEIANQLGLGVETVRYYRKSIMRKLKVHNVAELLRVVGAENLILGAGGENQ